MNQYGKISYKNKESFIYIYRKIKPMKKFSNQKTYTVEYIKYENR